MRHILPNQMLSTLSDLLAEQTGLNFPEERWCDLERGMDGAARESGETDVEAYVRRVLSAPLTHQQTEILASHLTVGETYFFRDSQSFEALEQYVLPQLILSRRETGCRLRIWCAGCCTGEEPYSIAMLLDRLLPEHEQWNITVLATDINPHFLRKAAEGSYGDWSFRNTPAWLKQRYFNSGRQGRFEILPRIKKRVTFTYLNLADDVYPSLSNNTNAMDLILCRNVLMYLTVPQTAKIVDNLHHALVDDGWLLTSAVEASNTLFTQFTPVNFSGAVFYLKATAEASQVARTPYPAPEPAEAFQGALETPRSTGETASFIPPPKISQSKLPVQTINEAATPADTADSLCATARLCANQGKLAEAVKWCEQAIDADKLYPISHYLLATIRQELGQADVAEQSLKRALYLDPDLVLAHFTLGNLCLSQGRYEEAKRYFGNALALLRQHLATETLAEADGLTAGRLNEIILSVMDSLPYFSAIPNLKAAPHENRRASHAPKNSH